MDLSALKPVLDALGVNPQWYPVMVCLGIINQYGKGMLKFWDENFSFGLAALAGAAIFADSLFDHMAIGPAALRAVIMAAACLVTESLVDKWVAPNVPWMPKANEWAKTDATTPKP